MRSMSNVVDLLARPVYGFRQVDQLLALRPGTSRRWVDGYDRAGKHYRPVIRDTTTGGETVTWGEFVETRLLAEFRHAGVSIMRMRPAVERLREELGTPYPLATARTWLSTDSRELLMRVQTDVGLERELALVVVRTGQGILPIGREHMQYEWTAPVESFTQSLIWGDTRPQAGPTALLPVKDIREVTVDPLRGFGEPVVRNVRTEIIAELIRTGDTVASIAEAYELEPRVVEAALRYELTRNNPAA